MTKEPSTDLRASLEHDLIRSDWMLEKVRTDDYAQKLYATLCNNEFQRQDVWTVLSDQLWSCTWRYAGGIIASMRQEGDYMDWYCSGGEGYVDEEVAEDLAKLGWRVVDEL